MKEMVYSSGSSSTQEILSTTLQHINGEARHQLPSLDSLSRTKFESGDNSMQAHQIVRQVVRVLKFQRVTRFSLMELPF